MFLVWLRTCTFHECMPIRKRSWGFSTVIVYKYPFGIKYAWATLVDASRSSWQVSVEVLQRRRLEDGLQLIIGEYRCRTVSTIQMFYSVIGINVVQLTLFPVQSLFWAEFGMLKQWSYMMQWLVAKCQLSPNLCKNLESYDMILELLYANFSMQWHQMAKREILPAVSLLCWD